MNSPTRIKDEPLRLHEVAFASVIICAAAASVAVAFTTIATCQYPAKVQPPKGPGRASDGKGEDLVRKGEA